MGKKNFAAGEKVIITVESQIICERDGKYLVRGFGYPVSEKNIKKVTAVQPTAKT